MLCGQHTRSALCVPLKSKGRVVAVVQVLDKAAGTHDISKLFIAVVSSEFGLMYAFSVAENVHALEGLACRKRVAPASSRMLWSQNSKS